MLMVKDKGIIIQIIKRCKRILNKIENIEYEEFENDDDLKEIISFNIFQIGELTNNLSKDFLLEYQEIPWKYIIGMRNRIVHGYNTINVKIVFNTAIKSVSELLECCLSILKKELIINK